MSLKALKVVCEKLLEFCPTEPQLSVLEWLSIEAGTKGTMAVGRELGLPVSQPEALLLCGRGSGKTTLACLYAIISATSRPECEVLICASSLSTAYDVLVSRLRELLEPPLIRGELKEGWGGIEPTGTLRGGTTKRQLVFNNRSTITVIPNSAAAVRGRGPRIVICDEVQSWPWASSEERDLNSFLNAVRPRQAVDYGDDRKIVLLGTPSIAAGPFFELWKSPPRNFSSIQLPTYRMRTDKPNERFEELKEDNPRLYRIEIEAQWGSTTDGVLDLDRLDDCMTLPEPKEYGTKAQNISGDLVIGCDVGLSRDYTGFCVMSKVFDDEGNPLHVVHFLQRRHYKGDVGEFVTHVQYLRELYPGAPVLLDQYCGPALQELLNREGVDDVRIVYWTSANRSAAIDWLIRIIHERSIRLPDSPDLRSECATLVEKHTSTGVRRIEHTTAGHDDLFFSILMCTEELKNVGAFVEPFFIGGAPDWAAF